MATPHKTDSGSNFSRSAAENSEEKLDRKLSTGGSGAGEQDQDEMSSETTEDFDLQMDAEDSDDEASLKAGTGQEQTGRSEPHKKIQDSEKGGEMRPASHQAKDMKH